MLTTFKRGKGTHVEMNGSKYRLIIGLVNLMQNIDLPLKYSSGYKITLPSMYTTKWNGCI